MPSPLFRRTTARRSLSCIFACFHCSAPCFFPCSLLFLRRRLFSRPCKALYCICPLFFFFFFFFFFLSVWGPPADEKNPPRLIARALCAETLRQFPARP